MALYLWNQHDYFRKTPPIKSITLFGKRKWDSDIECTPSTTPATNGDKVIFTMPSFARHGRWGNMVFQYIFIRVLAINNNGQVELNRVGEQLDARMLLYKDLVNIPTVQTKSNKLLLDNYAFFAGLLTYIPSYIWRALYVCNIRKQECFILENADQATSKPLLLVNAESIEVEGLFLVNPKLYKQHKEFIFSTLFQPEEKFRSYIDNCVQNLGEDKTIVGIHIRRGDFVSNPFGQPFQFPIGVKYITDWLVSNISSLKNPVILVCSDDPNAYREIKIAGCDVFYLEKLLPPGEILFRYEQLEWEILRKCDILLTSNSSFSFSAALLNTKNAICYRFSVSQKKFISFDPWESEPLQLCTSSRYIWSYLYSRFSLTSDMVSKRAAFKRLLKDVRAWVFWKSSKVFCFYYMYGFSLKFCYKLFNLLELFRLPKKNTSYLH